MTKVMSLSNASSILITSYRTDFICLIKMFINLFIKIFTLFKKSYICAKIKTGRLCIGHWN